MTMSLLKLTNISKRFPGVQALDQVDFNVNAGEVHALLGENGAGKSTLIKVITGVYQRDFNENELYTSHNGKDSGIFLQGVSISPAQLTCPADAQALGVSTVYQEVNLLSSLSVAHNIYLGREPKKYGLIDWKTIYENSRELLQRFDLDLDVKLPLASFSIAIQQLIAIARSVDMSAKLLILDEPTASLDASEVKKLFNIIHQLKSEGLGIVFITHFLDQVYDLSDRITVLRNGKTIGCYITANLSRALLIEKMLGKELQELSQSMSSPDSASTKSQENVLSLHNIFVQSSIENISLNLHRGQTMGLAGLLGSGRTEVCNVIFAIDQYVKGTMSISGSPCKINTPRDAIAAGFALCPEDRKSEGIIGPLSIRENIILALQARLGWWRPISKKKQQQLSEKAIVELGIVTPSDDKPIEQLSGGNQQKVILARWLVTEPKLLILDEPTRGIDIGAHAEIIKLIRKLCAAGMALLVTSSELEELVAFSNQVIVMRDKRQVCQLDGDDISEANIMAAIACE